MPVRVNMPIRLRVEAHGLDRRLDDVGEAVEAAVKRARAASRKAVLEPRGGYVGPTPAPAHPPLDRAARRRCTTIARRARGAHRRRDRCRGQARRGEAPMTGPRRGTIALRARMHSRLRRSERAVEAVRIKGGV